MIEQMLIPQTNQVFRKSTSMPRIPSNKVYYDRRQSQHSTRKVPRRAKKVNDVLDRMMKNEQISRLVSDNKITGNCESIGDVDSNPLSRRSSVMTILGDKVYMFGGISFSLMNDMHTVLFIRFVLY